MPQPDSKQLRILKKLTTHLEGITPDNGYDFDMRGKIYRGYSILPVDAAEDAISILEAPKQDAFLPVGGPNAIRRTEAWTLLLQGWPQDDPENPSDPAYQLKAAVEKRLAEIVTEKKNGMGPTHPELHLFGGDLTTFVILPGVVRPPEDAVSRLAMFYMPLVLGVNADLSNPYS